MANEDIGFTDYTDWSWLQALGFEDFRFPETQYGVSPVDFRPALGDQVFEDPFGPPVQPAFEITPEFQSLLQNVPPEDLRDWGVDTTTGQIVDTKTGKSPESLSARDAAIIAAVQKQPTWQDRLLQFGIPTAAALAGTGVARLITGGPTTVKLPELTGPGPVATAGQNTLLTALTSPALRNALTLAQGGDGTWSLPGTPGMPSATGGQDLERLIRSALTGQRTIADLATAAAGREFGAAEEEAPLQRLYRLAALAQLPAFMARPGQADAMAPLLQAYAAANLPPAGPMTDPTTAALTAELEAAFAGKLDPETERRIAEARTSLRNTLAAQLLINPGDVELTTPGAQRMAEFERNAEELRGGQRRQTISTLAPIEQQRRQFNVTTPLLTRMQNLGLLLPEERIRTLSDDERRRVGLAEQLTFSGLGRINPATTAGTLSNLLPISPLLGIQQTDADRQLQNALRVQAALSGFQAETQGNRDLATAINQAFGIGASALAPRASSTMDLLPLMLAGGMMSRTPGTPLSAESLMVG